jgi:hypothetical protein
MDVAAAWCVGKHEASLARVSGGPSGGTECWVAVLRKSGIQFSPERARAGVISPAPGISAQA